MTSKAKLATKLIVFVALLAAILVPTLMGAINWNLFITVCFLGFPALMIFLSLKIALIGKIGLVLLCYLFGMLVGNIGILPDYFTAPGGIQMTIQDISVALALPLILFSIDIKKWFKTSKKGLLCMLLAIIAISLVTLVLQFVFFDYEHTAHLAGMATGVYTGGTPNIAAIANALDVNQDIYIQFITYDTITALIFVFFCCSIGRVFFQKVFRLRKFESAKLEGATEITEDGISDESIEAYKGMFKKDIAKGLICVFLLAAGVLGVSYLVASLFPQDNFMMVLFFTITTLSILCSCSDKIRNVKKSFQLGMYIIYIFCFTIATMASFDNFTNINWTVLAYVVIATFGGMIVHAILCKICKIDSDTFIIVSVSAICSPPFVPVVAGALKNKEVLITGLITGVIGYAIGNYLGIGIGVLFGML